VRTWDSLSHVLSHESSTERNRRVTAAPTFAYDRHELWGTGTEGRESLDDDKELPDPRLFIPRNVPPGWLWHPRAIEFCEAYGIDRAIVEAAAEAPQHVYIDPMSQIEGYLLVGRRRGDVVAIVSYRETIRRNAVPMIVYARVVLPMQRRAQQSGAGTGGGTSMPKTIAALNARILQDGMSIDRGKTHARATAPDGTYLATLPITPSEYRSIPNCWRAYVRNRDEWLTRERVKRGDLLRRRRT